MKRAKDALASLPWVDMGSVKADVETQQVQFRVTDEKQFDETALTEAFKKKRFANTKVVSKGG